MWPSQFYIFNDHHQSLVKLCSFRTSKSIEVLLLPVRFLKFSFNSSYVWQWMRLLGLTPLNVDTTEFFKFMKIIGWFLLAKSVINSFMPWKTVSGSPSRN